MADSRKAKDVILGVLLIIVTLTIGAILLREAEKRAQRDVKVQVDTLYIYDSIIVREPVKVAEIRTVTEYIPVPDMHMVDSLSWELDSLYWANCELAFRNDSLMLALQMTQAHYADSTYDAWVSGWKPRLDSIKVYPTERLIIRTETREVPRSWGFGVAAGPGVFIDLHGQMHMGGGAVVGFYYNF